MALAIGKRKRRQDISDDRSADANDSDDDAAARALFQRAFEKKFKPLERTEKPKEEAQPNTDSNDDDDDDDDDDDVASNSGSDPDASDAFSGFSATSSDDSDSDSQPAKPQIEVITDSTPRQTRDRASEKLLKKQFMSAKPPTASSTSSKPSYPVPHKPTSTSAQPSADADDDSTDIQNDLALQRLLKESHLLDASTFSATGSASSAPEGSARQRALDMRIRDLGAKKSHLQQEKMPLAMRRGMAAKAGAREGKRRAEARESGVVLERFGGKAGGVGAGGSAGGGGKERPRAKRAVGMGGPGVGTFRGATLRLSKSDVRGIEGGGGGRGGKGGGRGGKKRKGGMNFGSGF